MQPSAHPLPDPLASRAPNPQAPALFLVTFEPASGVDDAALNAWYGAYRRRLDEVTGLVTSRLLKLADQQLLPHRATAAARYAVLTEMATWTDLVPAAVRMHPAQGGRSSSVDIASARSGAFVMVTDVARPPLVPAGAPPRPSRRTGADVPGTGAFLALTRPMSVAEDSAYNDWYDERHLPETLLLDGVSRGRRYRRVAAPATVAGRPAIQAPYLTYYDLEDVSATSFNRDQLLPWLETFSVEHLGPAAYDRSFTQAFVMHDVDAGSAAVQ